MIANGNLERKANEIAGKVRTKPRDVPGKKRNETRTAGDEVWKHAVARARRLIGQEKENQKKNEIRKGAKNEKDASSLSTRVDKLADKIEFDSRRTNHGDRGNCRRKFREFRGISSSRERPGPGDVKQTVESKMTKRRREERERKRERERADQRGFSRSLLEREGREKQREAR